MAIRLTDHQRDVLTDMTAKGRTNAWIYDERVGEALFRKGLAFRQAYVNHFPEKEDSDEAACRYHLTSAGYLLAYNLIERDVQ